MCKLKNILKHLATVLTAAVFCLLSTNCNVDRLRTAQNSIAIEEAKVARIKTNLITEKENSQDNLDTERKNSKNKLAAAREKMKNYKLSLGIEPSKLACLEVLIGTKITKNIGKSLGLIDVLRSIYNIHKIDNSEVLSLSEKIKTKGLSVLNNDGNSPIGRSCFCGDGLNITTDSKFLCNKTIGANKDIKAGLSVTKGQYIVFKNVLYLVTSSGTDGDNNGRMNPVKKDGSIEDTEIKIHNLKSA